LANSSCGVKKRGLRLLATRLNHAVVHVGECIKFIYPLVFSSSTCSDFFVPRAKFVSSGCRYWFFLVGLGFNAVLYRVRVNSVEARQKIYFEFRVREALERIEARFTAYQQALLGLAGFFDAHGTVSRQQFREYVDRQSLSLRYPGIQGLGFAKAISPTDLETHTLIFTTVISLCPRHCFIRQAGLRKPLTGYPNPQRPLQ